MGLGDIESLYPYFFLHLFFRICTFISLPLRRCLRVDLSWRRDVLVFESIMPSMPTCPLCPFKPHTTMPLLFLLCSRLVARSSRRWRCSTSLAIVARTLFFLLFLACLYPSRYLYLVIYNGLDFSPTVSRRQDADFVRSNGKPLHVRLLKHQHMFDGSTGSISLR